MICDFCASPQQPVIFEYPCTDFVAIELGPIDMGMNGSWMACQECSALIDRGELSALAVRQIESRRDLPEDINFQAEIIGILVQAYMRFQSHRTGPRLELSFTN
jgi:hypothetical protein